MGRSITLAERPEIAGDDHARSPTSTHFGRRARHRLEARSARPRPDRPLRYRFRPSVLSLSRQTTLDDSPASQRRYNGLVHPDRAPTALPRVALTASGLWLRVDVNEIRDLTGAGDERLSPGAAIETPCPVRRFGEQYARSRARHGLAELR